MTNSLIIGLASYHRQLPAVIFAIPQSQAFAIAREALVSAAEIAVHGFVTDTERQVAHCTSRRMMKSR
jgi:hypothetical protein